MTSFWKWGSSSLRPCLAAKPPRTAIDDAVTPRLSLRVSASRGAQEPRDDGGARPHRLQSGGARHPHLALSLCVFARSIGRRPVAITAAGGSGTWMSGGVFARISNRRRWAAGAARRQRAGAAVPGRLIEHAVTVHGLCERRRIGILRDLE